MPLKALNSPPGEGEFTSLIRPLFDLRFYLANAMPKGTRLVTTHPHPKTSPNNPLRIRQPNARVKRGWMGGWTFTNDDHVALPDSMVFSPGFLDSIWYGFSMSLFKSICY